MNELTLRINQNPGSIELNFDELEVQLDNKLAEYKGAVFTEDSKTYAKKEVANLRKLKKDIDDARKAVKKKWMEPYDSFDDRMKKLMKKVDEPINLINEQVEEFEKKRIEKKRAEIKKAFNEFMSEIPDYQEYIHLEKIYNAKWENASVNMKSVRSEMEQSISSIITAVDTIRSMNSDKSAEALKYYLKSGNLPEAISMITKYEQDKARILKEQEEKRAREEERRKQMELERIRAEERAAIEREERIRAEERARMESEAVKASMEESAGFDDTDLPFEQPSTITAFYKVVATAEELEQVEMAFNSIGIYFERRDA